MLKLLNRYLLGFSLITMYSSAFGQFMDKSRYIVDSLSKEKLKETDIVHLDSLVPLYYKTTTLEKKLDVLDKILERTPNSEILCRYSSYLIQFTSDKLTNGRLNSAEIQTLKKYKGIGYNYKGLYFKNIGESKSSRLCIRKSLALFKSVDFKVGLGYVYNNMAADFSRSGNLDSALYYYNKGLDINVLLDEKVGIASLQYNMAGILEAQGKIVEAVELYHKTLSIFEELENKIGVAYTLHNLAAISSVLDDYNKAIEYELRSKRVFEEIGDQLGVGSSLNNLGAMYHEKGELDKAFFLINKSLTIRESINNKPGIIECLNNLAEIHLTRGETKVARKKLERALTLCRAIENQKKLASTLNSIARLDIMENKWVTAKQRSDSALVIGQQIKDILIVRDASNYLMEIAEHTKDWRTAFAMQSLYFQMRDSTRSDEARNAVILGEMTYKHEKKELADSLHFAEMETIERLKHEKSIEQATIYTISGILSALLMLILAVVIFLAYRQKQRSNISLSEKNQENELLLREIHHRVKNNLQVISSLLALQERSITDEKAKAAIIDGRKRVLSIGLIHKHLYQNNNFSTIEMREYVSNLVDGLIETMGNKAHPIQFEIDIKAHNLDVDKAVPLGLIINELVVNVIKHAYVNIESPFLKVTLTEENGNTVWGISDNGAGSKADIEQSNSFGMMLIRSLTRQLEGVFDIEENNGLQFKITFKS